MVEYSSKSFYITVLENEGNVTGYKVSPTPPTPTEDTSPASTSTPEPTTPHGTDTLLAFATVFSAFVSMMESYRKFAPLALRVAPLLYSAFTVRTIADFAKTKGKQCLSFSTKGSTVYELDVSCYREFTIHNDEVEAMEEGARLLPEVMVIGLVSSYDAFLSQLLRVVLNMHPEIVLTSDKTIKFSELSKFSSIDDARNTLIDREIEGVIRSSHHEQFSWMENRFSMKLRDDLLIWPHFVELCKRRNLLTHTGGVVSAQYLANCKVNECDVAGVEAGGKLAVDSQYFERSVSIIYEVGTKLCHVFWRRFAADEREEADWRLNELCYNLIYGRAYPLAESLLSFGTTILKKHSSDSVRRTMIVNLANCIRLQNREQESKEILDKEGWSAVDNNFKICVASVYGDIEKVLELMPTIGASGRPTAADYRTWPVFSGIRTDKRFLGAFEKIFGEPLITSGGAKIDQTSDAQNAEVVPRGNGASGKTLH
jgi:hypothetical protein